jgi:hypothetical protein
MQCNHQLTCAGNVFRTVFLNMQKSADVSNNPQKERGVASVWGRPGATVKLMIVPGW